MLCTVEVTTISSHLRTCLFVTAALNFYNKHFASVAPQHKAEVTQLAEIITPEQLAASQLAGRFRSGVLILLAQRVFHACQRIATPHVGPSHISDYFFFVHAHLVFHTC